MTLATTMKGRPTGRHTRNMTTQTIGANPRPRLSPRYGAKAANGAPKGKRRSPTLSTLELRRLVAAMVD